MHNAAFSWRSFMSPIVAMSTSEAESHWSLCLCERHSILSEVWAICTYTVTRPAKLFEDNVSHLQSMGILQAGPSTFTCAGCLSPTLLEMGSLNCTELLPPWPTEQVAEIGTKALPLPLFCALPRSLHRLRPGLSLPRLCCKHLPQRF